MYRTASEPGLYHGGAARDRPGAGRGPGDAAREGWKIVSRPGRRGRVPRWRTWTFTNPGLVRVFCNIHPRLVAFVQVMAGSHFPHARAGGRLAVARVPPASSVRRGWP